MGSKELTTVAGAAHQKARIYEECGGSWECMKRWPPRYSLHYTKVMPFTAKKRCAPIKPLARKTHLGIN